jgi:hypothetical protein
MSAVRFLADNDLAEVIITGLRKRCPMAEFNRIRDVASARLSDPEVLEFAAARGYVVVSHDVSTMSKAGYDRIRSGQPMRGLLLIHQDSESSPILEFLEMICSASEAEEWHDQVVFLARR